MRVFRGSENGSRVFPRIGKGLRGDLESLRAVHKEVFKFIKAKVFAGRAPDAVLDAFYDMGKSGPGGGCLLLFLGPGDELRFVDGFGELEVGDLEGPVGCVPVLGLGKPAVEGELQVGPFAFASFGIEGPQGLGLGFAGAEMGFFGVGGLIAGFVIENAEAFLGVRIDAVDFAADAEAAEFPFAGAFGGEDAPAFLEELVVDVGGGA